MGGMLQHVESPIPFGCFTSEYSTFSAVFGLYPFSCAWAVPFHLSLGCTFSGVFGLGVPLSRYLEGALHVEFH